MARGPAYPYVDLQGAIDLLQKLYAYTRRGPAVISALAKEAWGWSPTSSTASKAVAALKYFGLIDESPGNGKQIKVSDRGLRILLDDVTSPERRRALEEAALSPTQYQYCYRKWGADVPPAARSTLIFERGFGEGTVQGFLRDYKKSLAFAGLVGAPNEDGDVEGSNDTSSVYGATGDEVQSAQQVAQQPMAKQIASGQFPTAAPAAKEVLGMRQDVFSLAEGPVTIQWPATLSPESLEDFNDWLDILKRKVGRSVGVPANAKTDHQGDEADA